MAFLKLEIMKSSPQLVFVLIVWCFCLGLILGCGKRSADAVARVSKSKPVFGSETVREAEKKSGDINFDFVHADHFACFGFNVDRIVSYKEFNDVSWEFLESGLAELVGQDNARLERIERVWLLLDRESVSMAMDGDTDGMLVTVIEYQAELSSDQLASINSISDSKEQDSGKLVTSRDESESESKLSNTIEPSRSKQVVAKTIGKKRVVIGSRQLIAKLKSPQQSSELSRRLNRLDFSADVEGVVMAGPVRETLKSLFGLAAQFGGAEAKKFASLPDALDQVEVKMSVGENESDELLSFKAIIDDPSMVEQIVRTTQQAISQSSSSAGGFGPTGIGMFSGGGFSRGRNSSATVYPLKTTKIAEQFTREIEDKNLFTVEGAQDHVAFRLRRPEQTSALVKAVVADSQRAAEFESRVAKMSKVAAALKQYHEKYGCFPPPGMVRRDSSEENSIPAQLNWRVGLLPFLDEQALYERFDFEQKWDSEANLKVARAIPDVFSINDDVGVDPMTRFHLPGGEFGVFADFNAGSDSEPKKLADITDRKPWTAIVVESDSEDEVIWIKPDVLRLSKDSVSEPGKPLGRADENGVLVVSAAFKARVVKNDPVAVLSVLTAKGGEKLTTRDFYSVTGN